MSDPAPGSPWSLRGDRGVAHVLSAGVSVIDPAACKVLVVMTSKHTRRRHVTRRVDDRRKTPQTLGLAGLSGSVMSLIKPGTRRKRGPSQTIVRLASAPSRRFALLRPRCRAANGLDRAVRQPHAAIVDGPREQRPHRHARRLANLLTTRIGGAIVKWSLPVAHRNPLRVARCGAHGSPASGHGSFSYLDTLPG